jgi:hypothetical protein
MTKSFAEQRWAIDNIIRANEIDWDQPRSIYLSACCGVEATADFAAIRDRVQKMADIGPVFETTAKRREARARTSEAESNLVTARDTADSVPIAIYFESALRLRSETPSKSVNTRI